jgi:quercetin dioxygenase-like cupin family protein
MQAVLLGLLCAAVAYPDEQSEQKSIPGQQSLVFSLETAKWSQPYDGPLGFPKGVQKASLGTDPVTGGETYYARFPAGSHFDPHWHSYAEYATVLSGKVTLTLGPESQSLSDGDYVVIPAKMNHEWKVDSDGELLLFVRRDGTRRLQFR